MSTSQRGLQESIRHVVTDVDPLYHRNIAPGVSTRSGVHYHNANIKIP